MSTDLLIPEYPFDFSFVPREKLGEYMRQLFRVRCKQMPRILAYIPLPSQYLFHVSPSKERMPSGGNQSGKTFSAGWDCSAFAERTYPDWFPDYNRWPRDQQVKIRLVGGNLQENIQNIMVPMINWWLEDINPVKWLTKRNLTVGGETADGRAVFYCISEKQGLRAHEGWTGHYVYIDEALAEEFYNANLRGTIKYKGKVVMAQTPLADVEQNDWIDKRFPMGEKPSMDYDKPCRIQLITTDNLYLDEKEANHFAEQMKVSGADQYAARVLGYSPAMVRRVLKEYDPSFNVLPSKKLHGATTYFAIDPHPAKGEAMGWLQVLEPRPGFPPAKVLVCDYFDMEHFNTYGKLVDLIKEMEAKYDLKPILRACDQRFAQALNKETGNNFLYEFQKAASAKEYPMSLVPAKAGAIEDGNNHIRRMLANTTYEWDGEDWAECREFRIMENCKTTLQAMYKYSYDRGMKKVENNQYKDPIDVLRYLFSLPLGWRRPEVDRLLQTDDSYEEKDSRIIPYTAL